MGRGGITKEDTGAVVGTVGEQQGGEDSGKSAVTIQTAKIWLTEYRDLLYNVLVLLIHLLPSIHRMMVNSRVSSRSAR